MTSSTADTDSFLSGLISNVRGPGGAIAIVKDGELLTRRTWGYSNLENRICMTERTLMPICSISKHMLVLSLTDAVRKYSSAGENKGSDAWQRLDAELRRMVPQLFEDGQHEKDLKVEDLFNMQSGIRDYWAMTVLWGARPDDVFSIADHAPQALERTKSFHFTPGSEFSYSNVNFHILGRLAEKAFGHSVGQLLAHHLFIPANMSSAALCPNTAGLPQPVRGYEGSEKAGYWKATNQIEWVGDAAIVASLEDMIAYEKYLDHSWKDKDSLYSEIAKPATFSDGNWASYSHGLGHDFIGKHETIGHTGALRGFRMARFHVPDSRLSVVVMLNHEASAKTVAQRVLKFMLGVPEEKSVSGVEASKSWEGNFFVEKQQRVISVESPDSRTEVIINYDGHEEELKLKDSETAESSDIKARIDGDVLHVEVPGDNAKLVAHRIPRSNEQPANPGIDGEYYCSEVDSTFTCDDSNSSSGIAYGAFTGYLGQGPTHQMRYVGADIWILMCPRSMDAPAPGEWSVVFRRGSNGKVEGAIVGCWLARKLEFVKKN